MAAPTADPVLRENMDAVYTHFDAHDWDADTEFQAGIAGIVEAQRAQGASEPDIAATIDRAKAFYFSSKVAKPFTHEDYLVWRAAQPAAAPAAAPDADMEGPTVDPQGGRYPPSFDAIVELISTGRTDEIPGIRDIPLKINEEPPTEAVLPKRPKPWEAAEAQPAS